MTQYSFNSGWKFFRGVQNGEVINLSFDDSPWEAVTLEHTARLEPVNVSGGEDHRFKTALSRSATGQDIGIIPFKHSNVRYIRVKIKNVSKGTAGFFMFEVY